MTLHVLVWSSLLITLVGLVVGYIIDVQKDQNTFQNGTRMEVPRSFKPSGTTFLVPVTILVTYAVFLILNELAFLALAHLNVRWMHLLLASAVLVFGTAAFAFKRWNRFLYGIVEISFAWFTAVSSSQRLTASHIELTAIAGLVGSAYFVSRGLENAAEGINEWYRKRGGFIQL